MNPKRTLRELAEALWETNRAVYEYAKENPEFFESMGDILAPSGFIGIMEELREVLDASSTDEG